MLASVKSFFGSRGVAAEHVTGESPDLSARKLYALLNDPVVRDAVVDGATARYGYDRAHIQLRLYVGKFAAPKLKTHEPRIRAWCAQQHVGAGPIQVIGVGEVVKQVSAAAAHSQYRDNPALVTMKVLEAAGVLTLELPDDVGTEQ